MNESIYKSYDELPLFLNARMVAQLLGVSNSSAYELMHEKGFVHREKAAVPQGSHCMAHAGL